MKWFGILTLLAIFLFPQIVKGEIATTKDWIGLFDNHDSSTDCTVSDTVATCRDKTVNRTSWAYTNSCTKTAGSTPALANSTGCNIIPNPLPTTGTFEYRMYAYDQGTPDALIAVSKTIPATTAGATPGPGGGVPCPPQAANPRVINGLISAPNVGENFGNSTANCVTGNLASFVPYKIPSYDDIKSIYFTQAKTIAGIVTKETDVADESQISLTSSPDHLYHVIGNLNIGGNIPGNQTGVIFVDGNLTINPSNKKLTTNNPAAGLVFVVGGNVNIASTVTQIDAVIIAGGKIFTAGAECSQAANIAAGTISEQLIVNGSLISLSTDNTIEFCRTLGAGNTSPAELINNEPKYLVILRNLYADTLQKWSEIQ